MNVTIRTEIEHDFKAVYDVVRNAFKNEAYSDHDEHNLVGRLRRSDAFVPGLSLVAEADGDIVGHILLTEIAIVDDNGKRHTSLALAPVAVSPRFQGKGIGGKLIEAAHQKAKDLGYGSVVVVGHEHYYPKFGYRQAKEFGIRLPFDIPDANCMAIELQENALQHINGLVQYPQAFNLE